MLAVVICEIAPGTTTDAIMAAYPRHAAVVEKYMQRGVVHGIGPFADRQGSLAIFETRAVAEEFVAEDPFILEGLVSRYSIKEWADALTEMPE